MKEMKRNILVKRRRKKKASPFGQFSVIDYKDTSKLKRFITERGKIQTRRSTGLCAKSQRVLVQAIKRARIMCLLPNVVE